MSLLSKDYWDLKDFCYSIFQSLNFIFPSLLSKDYLDLRDFCSSNFVSRDFGIFRIFQFFCPKNMALCLLRTYGSFAKRIINNPVE